MPKIMSLLLNNRKNCPELRALLPNPLCLGGWGLRPQNPHFPFTVWILCCALNYYRRFYV